MALKNKVAILTGAGRQKGIGAATAKLLASLGCHVLINTLEIIRLDAGVHLK